MPEPDLTIALGGDLIGPRHPVTPKTTSPSQAVFALLREADVAIANHEQSAFDIERFGGYQAAENGGGVPLTRESAAADLRAMGIRMVSKANNHATDWGAEGLLATLETLDRAGVVHAGAGTNLSRAREAAHLETRSARVALVSAASTFTPMSVAGAASDNSAGRPGLSPLHLRAVNVVGRATWDGLRPLGELQGIDGELGSRSSLRDGDLVIGDEVFRAGDDPGLVYEASAEDRAFLLRSVRQAAQQADVVVFAIHAHETSSGAAEDPMPPDALRSVYREVIDAGADIVMVTGPHDLRGVEVHDGRPIFVGLGSLWFELEGGFEPSREVSRAVGGSERLLTAGELIPRVFDLPDHWYDGAVAVVELEGDRPTRVVLHPLELSRDARFGLQGAPSIACGATAHRILARLRERCAQLGTELRIEADLGVIDLVPNVP